MNPKLEALKKIKEPTTPSNNGALDAVSTTLLTKLSQNMDKIKGDQGPSGYTPVKGKDYFTENEINQLAKHIQSNVKNGEQGKQGIQGIPGPKGEDGKDGLTPVKGIHYWTQSDQSRIVSDVLARVPKPKDGISPDINTIVSKVTEEVKKTPVNFKDIKGTEQLIEFLKLGGFRGGGGSGGGTTSPLTTKGDLYTYSTTNDRLPVGTDGYILSADSTQTTGLKWIANTGGTTTAYAETPSGTVNSSNVTFTLANTPASPNGVLIVLDGVTQYNGVDFTVSGTTITFVTAPVTGSTIFAYYNTFTGGGGGSGSVTSIATNNGLTGGTITTTGTIGLAPIAANSVLANLTGGSAVPSSALAYSATPTASILPTWDANVNMSANNFINGYTVTVTSATPVVLTVASTYQQIFSGSTNQIVKLPVTSTLTLGQSFLIQSESSGTVTVQSSGGNVLTQLAPITYLIATCVSLSGTGTASWIYNLNATFIASSKTLQVNNSLVFSGTDATTMTFPSTSATIARTDAAQTFTGIQTFATSIVDPLLVGGTAVGSSLSLQSTSGVGTTDFIKFLVGNNGGTEAMRILHSGNVGIGTTAPASKFSVGVSSQNPTTASILLSQANPQFIFEDTGATNANEHLWDIVGISTNGPSPYFALRTINDANSAATEFMRATRSGINITTVDFAAGTTRFGSSQQLQINSSGTITSATGITSGGTINFSGLSASLPVYTDGSKNLVSGLPSPQIVGSDRATGQTSAHALATYTVGASDTSFQVSANVLITTSTLHSFSVTCSYTDESNTARVLTLNFSQLTGAFVTTLTNALGASAYEGVPVHIRAKAGTTIIVQSTGTFTTVTYNLEERILAL